MERGGDAVTFERAVVRGGGLISAGLVVELVSFFWNHPLAFIVFAVLGGLLILAGIGVVARTAVATRSWEQPIRPPDIT